MSTRSNDCKLQKAKDVEMRRWRMLATLYWGARIHSLYNYYTCQKCANVLLKNKCWQNYAQIWSDPTKVNYPLIKTSKQFNFTLLLWWWAKICHLWASKWQSLIISTVTSCLPTGNPIFTSWKDCTSIEITSVNIRSPPCSTLPNHFFDLIIDKCCCMECFAVQLLHPVTISLKVPKGNILPLVSARKREENCMEIVNPKPNMYLES